MFDRYMLVENSLRPWTDQGEVRGIQVDVHYPHHCGIWLSIIEEINLQVDGSDIPAQDLTLVLDGKSYSVPLLTQELNDRWYFGQTGTLQAAIPGGLPDGEHCLSIRMGLRVSFLNWLLTGADTKTMKIAKEE